MTARVDLPGLGEPHAAGAAFFLDLDADRVATGDAREPVRMKPGTRYRVAHVVSRWARGEVRGYVVHDGIAELRRPAYPEAWPEVDRAIETALSVRVVGVPGTPADQRQLGLFGGAS